ncbi:MAG: serine/threonine-protein kinase [Myxococcota bacterium]
MSTPSTTTVKLPLPEQVIAGRYKLLKSLGQGGMGLVFLAEQLGVGNLVAVKFLDPEPTADDTRVARFLREARVGLEVKHPGAAQVLDLGRDESLRLFLVFEFIEGQDLRELIRAEGRLGYEEARDITLRVAEVLHFAHERGIVHRDVKPENIRVRRDLAGAHVKVLDFGIARLVKDTGVRLTAEGSLAGTPRYMSPEQVRDGPIDARTDEYALGLVLFEMLAGVPAFSGKNVSQILLKQVQEPLPPLKWADPQLDFPAVDAFLARCCAKSPEERFPSMADVVAALRALPVDPRTWPSPRQPPADARDSKVPTRDARGAGLSDTVIKAAEKTELSGPHERPTPAAGSSGVERALGGATRAAPVFEREPTTTPEREAVASARGAESSRAAGAPGAEAAPRATASSGGSAPSGGSASSGVVAPPAAASPLHRQQVTVPARGLHRVGAVERRHGELGVTVRGTPVPAPPPRAARARWPLLVAGALFAGAIACAWWLLERG